MLTRRQVAELLAGIHGGRVLDVATGSGRFARLLAESLAGYDEIIGVDNRAEPLAAAGAGMNLPRVSFLRADATALPFPDGAFDTVASSNSLHHLFNIDRTLTEMLRVLRSRGRIILAEMVAEADSPAQQVHHELHRLLAELNRRSGIVHNPTLSRIELERLYRSLSLNEVQIFESAAQDAPVTDLDQLEFIRHIREELAAARNQPEYPSWQHRAEELFEHVQEVGILSPNQLWLIGTKL